MPAQAGIQCAAACPPYHCCLWNAGSSAFADDDEKIRRRVLPSRNAMANNSLPGRLTVLPNFATSRLRVPPTRLIESQGSLRDVGRSIRPAPVKYLDSERIRS